MYKSSAWRSGASTSAMRAAKWKGAGTDVLRRMRSCDRPKSAPFSPRALGRIGERLMGQLSFLRKKAEIVHIFELESFEWSSEARYNSPVMSGWLKLAQIRKLRLSLLDALNTRMH